MSKKTRVTIDLTEDAMERLEDLRVSTEATSKADVIRRALRIYALLRSQEFTIHASSGDGTTTQVWIL